MKNHTNLIKKDKYKIIKQLSEIPYNTLFARSVLESKANGKVFVDNKDEPKTVLIAHSYGMSLLLGDTENLEFNASLADYMLNINGDRLKSEWLQVYPEKWNIKLGEILNEKIINCSKIAGDYTQQELDISIDKYRKSHIIQWGRVNFEYKGVNNNVNIASKYNIKLIDSNIYERLEGSVIPKYFWNSKENFLLDGIGYVIMNGNDIVSIAFSSCKLKNELEIGVETAENYRGMGFAKQVCQELLSYCQKNKYIPIWACKKENLGSYRLAKSLGFEESLILPYYELVH